MTLLGYEQEQKETYDEVWITIYISEWLWYFCRNNYYGAIEIMSYNDILACIVMKQKVQHNSINWILIL